MYDSVKVPGQVKAVGWLEKQLGMNVIMYLLFSWITLGIYPIVFGFKITRLLSELCDHNEKDSNTLRTYLYVAVGGGVGYVVFTILSPLTAFFGFLAIIGAISGFVCGILWAFKAREMMVDYYANVHGFPLAINGFLLFFVPNVMLLIGANTAERAQHLHKTVR